MWTNWTRPSAERAVSVLLGVDVRMKMRVDQLEEIGFPKNLVAEVLELATPEEIASITWDMAAGAIYILHSLQEREVTVLLLRYERRLTFAKIGESIGVSHSRAAQILEKAMRKLRHMARKKYILSGLYSYCNRITDMEKESSYKKGHEYGYKEGFIAAKEEKRRMATPEGRAAKIKEVRATHIGELDLSIRAWNCLSRAGCQTVNDVLSLDFTQIASIRNLGVRTICEIAKILRDLEVAEGSAWEVYLCSYTKKREEDKKKGESLNDS